MVGPAGFNKNDNSRLIRFFHKTSRFSGVDVLMINEYVLICLTSVQSIIVCFEAADGRQ